MTEPDQGAQATNTTKTAQASQIAQGAAKLGLQLNQRQLDRMQEYLTLLAKWNAVYNLTAIRDPERMLTQHVMDSLAAVPAMQHANRILDVGSGGGLPGMVIAIWAEDSQQAMRIAMIDKVHKKTAFLTQAKAQLGLNNVTIHTGQVQQLAASEQFDVITSRAFADLSDFVLWSHHVLAEDGTFIAMKGAVPDDEIKRLPAGWTVTGIQALTVPGLDAQRHLVFIKKDKKEPKLSDPARQ